MTKRLPCPPAPGPLEGYAARFDQLFASLAQRRGFRDYLAGLLSESSRNKTLTALADTEPVIGAQHREAQRLQYFLTEASWDHEAVNDQRLRLLREDPATAPHPAGVLIIDDTGDRKDARAMAHVAIQYLGSVGKVGRGIVATTSLWADEHVYWPAHVVPYTPAGRLPRGERDPGFATKPQLAVELVERARAAGIAFRAVTADCAYGDNDSFTSALGRAQVPFVLAVRPSRGTWAPTDADHTPVEAAQRLAWGGPDQPGDWTRVERTFRDGHTQRWWAADARLGGWGPDQRYRLVVATTDPGRLPPRTTWYLLTNLPHPVGRRQRSFPPASLAEVVRIYGLRGWVEQGYKQVKNELGWAQFQVRSDRAIRRHWALVCCAFSFCWQAARTPDAHPATADTTPARGALGSSPSAVASRRSVADGVAAGARLADPLARAAARLAGLVDRSAAPVAAGDA
jgi:DDE superfamily endonuclease